MKKKLLSPWRMRGRIKATVFDQLSAFHWMPRGEQALPVRSEDEPEVEDHDPVARLGQVLDSERHARIGYIEDRPHAALVIPLPGDGEADVDLVLMVGDEEFDRIAEHRAAEIPDRHSRHFDAARPREVGIGTGLVVHHPDGEALGRARRRRRYRQVQGHQKADGECLPDHRAAPGRGRFWSLAELPGKGNRFARCG